MAAASAKVKDSRAAASFLHSPAVLRHSDPPLGLPSGEDGPEKTSEKASEKAFENPILRFAGVAPRHLPGFLESLRSKKIGARAAQDDDGPNQAADLAATEGASRSWGDSSENPVGPEGAGTEGQGEGLARLPGGGLLVGRVAAALGAYEAALGHSIREVRPPYKRKGAADTGQQSPREKQRREQEHHSSPC